MRPADSQESPPPAAVRFLEWFCRREVVEEVRGDLDEAFAAAVASRGVTRARFTYWLEVLLFVRSHSVRRRAGHSRGVLMWKNYLHVALRTMRRHKAFTAINLMGLAVGLACTFMILLYVQDELSYDLYHPDADRIYRLVTGFSDENFDGIAKVNGAWGVATVREVPAVESGTRFVFFGQSLFSRGETRAYASGGFYADSTIFDVFSWRLLAGDPGTALVAPNSIVLTETYARTWFGDADPVGETIRVDASTDYRVTGVVEDVPVNSHFRFNFLASMSSYAHPRHDEWVAWNQYYTYVKLSPSADPEAAAAATAAVVAANIDADQAANFGPISLQPLTDIYLRSNMFREISAMGDANTVAMFFIVAMFILMIAAVNFINLSTARSAIRAREVGVRKSLGAARAALVRQFVSESILTVVAAAVVAAGLVALFLTQFNAMAGKSFELGTLLGWSGLVRAGALVVVIGVAAGIYPAFVLSAFHPARVMKGAAAPRGPVNLRKGLVVLQFVISAGLIMATGIVSDQLDYVRERPLGFDRELLANIPIHDDSLVPAFATIKAEMLAVKGVERVALSGNRPGGGDWGIPVEIPGMTRDEVPAVRMLVADHDFPATYGMRLTDGRSFDEARSTDAAHGLLVNREMARQMRWDDPIGQPVLMPAIDRELEVIGVLADFHFRSMHEAIAPLMMFSAPDDWYSMLTVRLAGDSVEETLRELGAVYERFDANNPFSYSFVSRQFDDLYVADRQVGDLLAVSTLLAMVIACMGLFGLAAFTAERRTQEIGVRKVVGASVGRIVALLTRETATLVGIALAVAVPIVVVLGRDWLTSFAYSGGVRPATIVLGAALAFLLAVLTTGAQAWRAARMNPAAALRTE